MNPRRTLCLILAAAISFAIAPLRAYAATLPFEVLPTYSNVAVGGTVDVICVPPGYTYTYSAYPSDIISVSPATGSNTAKVTGLKKGTGYLYIEAVSGSDTGTKLLTINVGGGVSDGKKLTISSSTSLDKKLGDSPFTFSVSFNVPKREVDYYFEIDDEDVATIDEDTGYVRIRRVGAAIITVTASANGYVDKDGNEYADATKDFTLYVDSASSAAAGTTGSSEIVLGGSRTASANTAALPTAGASTGPAADERYSNLEFKGNFTVNGMRFRATNNFSAGNVFALIPEDPNGDWWKTPNSFTGSRGVYSAKSAGIAPIIYADTTGKQYIININSYKLRKTLSFSIPERIPVGALFGVIPPVSTRGRWIKNSAFLSGNGGTYIALKTGATTVTFESEGKRYHIVLDIVSDNDAVAVNNPLESANGGGNGALEPIVLG